MSFRPTRVLPAAAVVAAAPLARPSVAFSYSPAVTTTNAGGCTFARESHKTTLSEAYTQEQNSLCGEPRVHFWNAEGLTSQWVKAGSAAMAQTFAPLSNDWLGGQHSPCSTCTLYGS